jgi:hypothetical protein
MIILSPELRKLFSLPHFLMVAEHHHSTTRLSGEPVARSLLRARSLSGK